MIKEAFSQLEKEITEHRYIIRRTARMLRLAHQENNKILRPEKVYRDVEKYFARTHPALQDLSVSQRRSTFDFFSPKD